MRAPIDYLVVHPYLSTMLGAYLNFDLSVNFEVVVHLLKGLFLT